MFFERLIIFVFYGIFFIFQGSAAAILNESKSDLETKTFFHNTHDDHLQIEEEGLVNLINFETNNLEEMKQQPLEKTPANSHQVLAPKKEYHKKGKDTSAFVRNIDPRKIQSDSKDISRDNGNNFIFERNAVLPPKHFKPIKSKNEAKVEKHVIRQKGVPLRFKKRVRTRFDKTKLRNPFKKYSGKPTCGTRIHSDINTRKSDHRRSPRAVVAKKERLWDHGVIPYEISRIFSDAHKALFKRAMAHWEKHTCIKFVERNPKEHRNYVYFTVQSCGCCAFVGKHGRGRQSISIGRNCERFGIVLHELGHVIGFWHEHTRTDRDEHIKINETNIIKGQEYNFNMLSNEEVDSLGLLYDFGSIMHYAKNTFSKSVYLDTIIPKGWNGEKLPEMGQRTHLSEGDIRQANLLYNCPKCGKTLQGTSGEFSSPNFASSLPKENYEQCEWRITAPQGERIILHIAQLNLLQSDNCDIDYIEIRDGYWVKSPLLQRLCGNITTPVTITSISSRMLVSYVNNNILAGFNGFKASFEVMCGGEIFVDKKQRIDSPNFPLEYPGGKECIWKITVPEGFEVALKFHSFELENHDSCIYDYLEIRDGDSPDSDLIGIFCGYRHPPSIKTNSNKIFVKFVSDNSVEKMGFSATFMKELDECKTTEHGCEQECINVLGGYECDCFAGYELQEDGKSCKDTCGGIIEAGEGTFSSPEAYSTSELCVWEIVAPENQNVFLSFSSFDFKGTKSVDCKIDYVKVYSKLMDSRLRRIGTFCGSELPPLIKSEKNILRIEFSSKRKDYKTKFSAHYFNDIDECATNNGGCQHYCQNTFGSYECFCPKGYTLNSDHHSCNEPTCKFEITDPAGVIFSPNYPEPYPRNTYCYWYFKTLPGQRIFLSFNEFEVEEHQECIYDYVAIHDGPSENSSTLGIYCGMKPPHGVFSSSNEMFMILKTDDSLQKRGFIATHSTDCGGYLRATNETNTFYSHASFGDKPYNKNMHCTWTLQADTDSSVKLRFTYFEIENSRKCMYDSVEIFEETNFSRSPYYGKFCGHKKPPQIISLSDTLFVHFKSDDSSALNGFAVTYVAVDPPEVDEIESYDSMTPFPGYMKKMHLTDSQEYYDDYDQASISSDINAMEKDKDFYKKKV